MGQWLDSQFRGRRTRRRDGGNAFSVAKIEKEQGTVERDHNCSPVDLEPMWMMNVSREMVLE